MNVARRIIQSPNVRACRSTETAVARLGDKGGRSGRLVLEVGRQTLDGLVVASEAVDTRLDQNQAELGVLVAAEFVEVLAHRDSLLDEAVEILRNVGREAC